MTRSLLHLADAAAIPSKNIRSLPAARWRSETAQSRRSCWYQKLAIVAKPCHTTLKYNVYRRERCGVWNQHATRKTVGLSAWARNWTGRYLSCLFSKIGCLSRNDGVVTLLASFRSHLGLI